MILLLISLYPVLSQNDWQKGSSPIILEGGGEEEREWLPVPYDVLEQNASFCKCNKSVSAILSPYKTLLLRENVS